MIGEKVGKPAAQRNLLRVLRMLLKVAVKLKMRRDNPALGIKLGRIETTGFHSWTEEELRQYESRHSVGTKARLALDLLLYTAERRKDVVALGPPNMRNGRLIYTASKNGAELDIPIAEPLASTIAATPMVGVKTFLVTEYGKPFTPAGFGNWFRDRCNEADLPLLGPRAAQGASAAHGRGGMQRGLHCLDQRPQGHARDQEIRTGGQQGEDGDGRHGPHSRDVPQGRKVNRNCQLKGRKSANFF
jgi:hypothetical protein